jgi:hypothetical protein
LDTITKEFLAIEFKRTQDARNHYVESATADAQEQFKSLLAGLQAVGQVRGWKVQQIVFGGGTCGSIHVESFNKNMKTLGGLDSLRASGTPFARNSCGAYLRNKTRCYGPTSHKREERGARGRT